jgi:signal transduction histidine kinase
MKFLGTVRFRLVIWNLVVIAVLLAVFGYSFRLKIESDLLRELDNGLYHGQETAASEGLPAFLLHHGITLDPADMSTFPNDPNTVAKTSFLITSGPPPPSLFPFSIVNLRGQAVYSQYPIVDPASVAKSLHGHSVFSDVHFAGQSTRVLSVPFHYRGRLICVLQLSRPLAPIYREVANIKRGFLTLIPLALLIVGLGALLLTERALYPVRDIVKATEGIEASDLSGRLVVRGSDEFSHLASTINNMLGRLDKAFRLLREASEQQRRFTADASHELRTPLTIIKANTSLALSSERTIEEYQRTLDAVDRAADRMARIVQDLLYIARSDAGQLFLASEPVKLCSVIQQSVEAISDLKGHTIKQELTSGAASPGDEDALVRLFTNLLQNASNYTPPGGTITIKCGKCDSKECWNVIKVIDTGIGISPEHIEHLGERFFRVDDGRARNEGGSGLGLAICRSIVAAHNGLLNIESTVGAGTTVTVKLPRIDPKTGACSPDQLINKTKITAGIAN